MSFIINFTNTSGEKGSVIPDLDFNYTDKLNDLNQGKINLSGTSESKRSLIEEGSTVEIKRNGTLEFAGEVVGTSYLDGGAVSARCNGAEFEMSKDHGEYSGSTWTSVASKTIYQEIIGEFRLLSLGTIDTGVTLDFKATETSSYFNVIRNLQSKTNQDMSIDYSTTPYFKVSILDHKGSSTSVETLNDGIDLTNLQVDRALPKGNKILVYGKGDGENQIKSVYPTSGQNATSQSAFGVIVWIERDPTVVSVDEANKLADVLAAAYGVATKIYRFDLANPSKDYVSGDVITLNSKAKDLDNEEVRIVGIERGMRSGKEYMTLQVTSKEYSKLLKTRDIVLGEIQRNGRDEQTYMQGTTNILTFSEMINADNTAPLRVKSYLEESFIKDEVGNLRVNSFTLDYDVDPFRSGVGSATEDDVAPTVSGTSASTTPGVSGDSGSTSPGVSGDSGSTAPGVSGDSGSHNVYTSVGSDSLTTVSCSSGSWTTVATVRPGSSYLNQDLVAEMTILGSSGGAEDIEVRIGNDSVYGYIDPGTSGSGASVWATYMDGFRDTSMSISGGIAVGTVTSSTHDIFVQVRPQTGAISLRGALNVMTIKHTHDDGTYAAANHDHSDGSYAASNHDHSDGSYAASSHGHADGSYGAASHNHNVSIGDGVSDSGSLNATEVSIYVDFWSGSAWVNKHSILNTGKTIDFNVDISNGGTYPDAPGFWRARVFTDNATGDLVQGTIKCKHQLDS